MRKKSSEIVEKNNSKEVEIIINEWANLNEVIIKGLKGIIRQGDTVSEVLSCQALRIKQLELDNQKLTGIITKIALMMDDADNNEMTGLPTDNENYN